MRRLALLALVLACREHGPLLHADPQALAYRSRDRVSDVSALRIAAEAVGIARRRPAWGEALHVHAADGPFGDGRDKYVYGEARLYLLEYESDPGKFREVDKRDDAVMAYADALYTMDVLQRWAGEAGTVFDVQLARLRGRVSPDGPDEAARKILALLQQSAAVDAAAAEAQRASLDQKYRDRR